MLIFADRSFPVAISKCHHVSRQVNPVIREMVFFYDFTDQPSKFL